MEATAAAPMRAGGSSGPAARAMGAGGVARLPFGDDEHTPCAPPPRQRRTFSHTIAAGRAKGGLRG